MQRLTLAFSGLLLLGSVGAFFLYVSILSIAAVMVLLVSMMLMFLLGVQAATHPIPVTAIFSRRKPYLICAPSSPSGSADTSRSDW
jgi:hypothetical protein